MKSHTVQIKISVMVDVQYEASTLEDAIQQGSKIKWRDLFHDEVEIADGWHKVVGVWDNNDLDYG